jgi:hypothetical protein
VAEKAVEANTGIEDTEHIVVDKLMAEVLKARAPVVVKAMELEPVNNKLDIEVQDRVDIAVEYITVRMMVDRVPDKQIAVGVEA